MIKNVARLFITTSVLFNGYIYLNNKIKRDKHIRTDNMLYFIENQQKYPNRYKNHNIYAIETECSITAERLAHEFSGLHFEKWMRNPQIDLSLNLFVIAFVDYTSNNTGYGHIALVKDGKIYHSYINSYKLKIEDFTEKMKLAINDKDHDFFAFNTSKSKKSLAVIQYIPNYFNDAAKLIEHLS